MARTTSGLPAVFKEQKLGLVFLGEIKTDGAVAAGVIAENAATGAHAVNVVDAEMSAHVEFAPGFDEDGVVCFLGQEKFQSGTFVFDVDDRRKLFERVVIQAV